MKVKNLFKTIKYITILVFILAPNYNSYAWGMKDFEAECIENVGVPPMPVQLEMGQIYDEQTHCTMTIRNYILTKRSEIEPTMDRLHVGNGHYYCNPIFGRWRVRDSENSYIVVSAPQDVLTVPTIPIVTLVKQLGEQLRCNISLYFNGVLMDNVELVSPYYYGSQKWLRPCFTNSMCQEQQQVCQKLNKQTKQMGFELNCSSLKMKKKK